jgi:hypothetical protein
MLRGACVVISKEAAEGQSFDASEANGRAVVIVDDPNDHASLGAALANLFTGSANRRDIAARGRALMRAIDRQVRDGRQLVDELEDLALEESR